MGATIETILDTGMQGIKIDIECHISNGLPAITVVGFGNRAIDEAKERLRSAFAEAGVELPKKRITLNLAPADVPKDGTSFDLAMAAAILRASNQIPDTKINGSIVIGELGLDGSVRPVRGIIGKLLTGRKLGHTRYYIPAANMPQANLIPGLDITPIESLRAFYDDQTNVQPILSQSSGVAVPKKRHKD